MTIEWMITTLLILIGGGVLLRRQLAFNHSLKASVQTQSIAPAILWLQHLPVKAQPTQYHRAITFFWKGYERSLATELAKKFLIDHPTVPVAHFWVKEILNVEPGIASQLLSSEFLEQEFNPELAACCGPTG